MDYGTIVVQIDDAGSFEVREHTITQLTPAIARRLVEKHAGQCYGNVSLRSSHPNPGTNDYWLTTYRVTPKSCRKIYDDFG